MLKRSFSTLILVLVILIPVSGQKMNKPSTYEIMQLPMWAQKMYADQPNVYEVDSLYFNYYRSHPYTKSYHTQYYKRWRRSVANQVNENGFVFELSQQELEQSKNEYLKKLSNEKSSNWSLVGPVHTQQDVGGQGKRQTNVYSIDQCEGQPTILYLGTEPGEVYKSVDGGTNWTNVSMTLDFASGVTAVEVHPTNGNIVFAGGNNGIYRSTDGGASWTNVLPSSNLNVNEILINPGNDQIVLGATDNGLYRSINGGTTWTQIYTQKSYDIKVNTGNNTIIYLLKNNPGQIKCEFFISTDMGATWTVQTNGWYNSTDINRTDGGARLAVSAADPNRVYAYLIGEAKANDYGYIGVYRSDDGGVTWTLPNGPAGGPYTASHMNLAYGGPTWTYHQGFYNCAIVASSTDPDQLLIGGLNLYRSDDGGLTFSAVSGYVGGPLDMHVDNQDFRMVNGNTWITTDGGAYLSTDFFNSQPDFKMDGVHGSDYWGFGSGWNEDVLVGGLYHNGNIAYHENYGPGNFLSLGGGEAATGYINPGNNRKSYFSDIGGVYLPLNYNDPLSYFSNGLSPNESYWAAESSEMEFHPNCYSIAFIGKDNKLWKTTDGGGSYTIVKEFGTSANDIVDYIEISSSNPDVMYVHQRPSAGSVGLLWKTTNGGVLWSQLTVPAGSSKRMLLAIDPTNENNLWIAYPSGSNGNKVFQTTDGGASWTNITTSALNNENIQSLTHVAGTNGGIYVGTSRSVYYRNTTLTWTLDNAGLPTFTSSNILRPFYRDGKIRVATYGKGIWESALNEQPSAPICRITVDKLSQNVFCVLDSFYFEDHSFLNHTGATWSWEFPTGVPATSSQRNPSVFFANSGNHLAVLTITDQFGNTDVDSLYVSVSDYNAPNFINEDFQNEFTPNGWFLTNDDNAAQWSLYSGTGGYGTSTQCATFDNYYNDSQGSFDDMNIPMNTLSMSALELTFDVAYAPYGGQYSDTLEILVSTDCGATFSSVYSKGGVTLSTAPTIADYYVPTASEWRTETVDLSAFVGENKVIVAFRNWGHYGNPIYIDNINILNDLGVNEELASEPTLFPNPVSCEQNLSIKGVKGEAKVKLLDNSGKVILQKQSLENETLRIPSTLSSGIYWINIETDTFIWNKKVIIR